MHLVWSLYTLLCTMNEVLAACLAMLIYSLLLYLPFSHTHTEDSEEPCALSLAVIFHTSRTWGHGKAWHLPECEEEPEWEEPCIVFKKLSLFFSLILSFFFSFFALLSEHCAMKYIGYFFCSCLCRIARCPKTSAFLRQTLILPLKKMRQETPGSFLPALLLDRKWKTNTQLDSSTFRQGL